jgi:hypothetical protein
MKISQAQEESVFERKLYMGVENFSVVAVNPTKQELIDMGINAQEEPSYVTTVEREVDGVKKELDAVSVRIFLDNNDANNRIRTQVNYMIIKDYKMSSTGKYLVLNKYGASTWLEEDYINASEMPANMQWYVNEGVKKAFIGEPLLIDFIKALYNLPNVTQKSTAETKEKGMASFATADIEKLFNGDFSDIRKTIAVGGKDQSVGFLLGVRETEGEYKQTLYNRGPLRSYIKTTNKTKYVTKDIQDAQDNGAYADSIFDLSNTKLKEFNEDQHTAAPDANLGSGVKDNDDLPF